MKFVPLFGRILYSAIFILFGLGHFTETTNMAAMLPAFFPAKALVIYLTGVVIVAAGVMVLVGYRARVAGLILALYTLSTAIFVHSSGFAAGEQVATANFMKDLALAGGGLFIWYFGSGPMSVDTRNASNDV